MAKFNPNRKSKIKSTLPFASAIVTPLVAGTPPPVNFSNDPNSIVSVLVKTINAPTPNTYQQCGAFVTWGGSVLAAQEVYELTQFSDLTHILIPAHKVDDIAWAAGVVTATLNSPLSGGWENEIGKSIRMAFTGFVPINYNGIHVCTIVSTTEVTFPITTDPGTATTLGTAQPNMATELSQMATTYFSQGSSTSVWVLELGPESTNSGIDAASLQTWLTTNPRSFYGYLLPRSCGTSTANIDLLTSIFEQYQSPEAMTYFWLTVVIDTQKYLGPLYKNVIEFIEAPSVTGAQIAPLANGEFSCAAMFYNAITFAPSEVNRVAPMAFRYLYGVTPYPTQNNGTVLASFKTDNVNYVATGAEGGISYAMVYLGVTLDGKDYFNWWWTIDWVQINAALDVANAIINGSNNPLAPLYYNQPGVRQLGSTLFSTMSSASTLGMVTGRLTLTELDQPSLQNAISNGTFSGMCDVNAVPFISYTTANPGDFEKGEYDGLSTLFIPARGFVHVLITIVASSLVTV